MVSRINKGARGWANSDDDRKYTPKGDSNPWDAAPSGHGYNAKFDDGTGYERVAGLTWDDKNTASFLKPSQTETDHGGGRDSVQDIYADVMADQGPGPYGEGGSSVKQVGGGSSPPRFKPKSSKQARDDQSNDGL